MKRDIFVKDKHRQAHLHTLQQRILKGKSTLILGNCGSGKTELLKQLKIEPYTVVHVESLGSVNYIMTTILQRLNYSFIPNYNKSVHYLSAICAMKKLVVIIDDITDLRPSFFRYIKRMMEAKIPVIMAGNVEIVPILKNMHEDVLARLRILPLDPLDIQKLKDQYQEIDGDSLAVISGFSFGNMFIFKEICEEALERLKEKSLRKVTVSLAQKIIDKYKHLHF